MFSKKVRAQVGEFNNTTGTERVEKAIKQLTKRTLIQVSWLAINYSVKRIGFWVSVNKDSFQRSFISDKLTGWSKLVSKDELCHVIRCFHCRERQSDVIFRIPWSVPLYKLLSHPKLITCLSYTKCAWLKQ